MLVLEPILHFAYSLYVINFTKIKVFFFKFLN